VKCQNEKVSIFEASDCQHTRTAFRSFCPIISPLHPELKCLLAWQFWAYLNIIITQVSYYTCIFHQCSANAA
jgi:hypothetical protein